MEEARYAALDIHLAFNVREIGPEFASAENQRAFLRIEESARQYSAHSRESIYLIRRPLEILEDHFVLLWPHGAAIVGMYPYGGSIRGRERGVWESEPPRATEPRRISMRSRAEHSSATFANPYSALERARGEFSRLLNHASLESDPMEVEAAQERSAGDIPGAASKSPSASTPLASTPIALIALFTGPVEQLRAQNIGDALFSAMTIEDAVARSIVHTPNLLRAADIPGVFYSNEDLERMSDPLERSARLLERSRKLAESKEPLAPASHTAKPSLKALRWKLSPTWVVPLLIVLAIIGFYAVRSLLRPTAPLPVTAPTPIPPRSPSEIMIKMPIEAELFISRTMFQTREQLDHALTYGEGMRFLPDTVQNVVMDSVSLAKGVYGYFKVDNSWRKGKLLQTLQPVDTIGIVKFLDPLP